MMVLPFSTGRRASSSSSSSPSMASLPLLLLALGSTGGWVADAILPPAASSVLRGGASSSSSSSSSPPAPIAARASPLFSSSSPSSTRDAGPDDSDGPIRPRPRPRAVVVGGGPVGLASALLLSNPPHSYDVSVFETTSGDASAMSYDPTKAFLYNVNSRGQVFTRKFPGVQSKLEERGVPMGGGMGGGGGITIVPGDPDEPLPESKPVSVGGAKGGTASSSSASYWIPRHVMVESLYESVLEHNAELDDGDDGTESLAADRGRIEYAAGMECVGVRPISRDEEGDAEGGSKGGEIMEVTLRDASTGQSRTVTGELVVGADGWKSAVRDCLLNGQQDFAHWPDFDHRRFKVKQWISPASGLKIKVLQFPPKFKIPDAGDRPALTTSSTSFYAIRSVNTGPRNYVSFGLLPMKDEDAVRATNVITRPNHEIWSLRTGEEVREWFQRAYPRLPFGRGDDALVPAAEWDRFADAGGTTFPPCQRSPGLAARSPGGECGVVLVGDAIHAFPPDIGQGINAGLVDVVWFDRALRGADLITGEEAGGEPPANLGDALGLYQKVRGPEVKALVKYSRFGAPYQYNQPLRVDRVGKALWTANVALRLVLNKVTFGLFPKGSILMAMDPDLTFRQVMRRADVGTAGLWSVVALWTWRMVRDVEVVKRLAGVAKSALGM